MSKEYQRICDACGKTWHSLVSRERQIEKLQKSNQLQQCGGAMQACGSCGALGSGTAVQAQRNTEAGMSELSKLRSCPECNSSTFKQRIIDHAELLPR